MLRRYVIPMALLLSTVNLFGCTTTRTWEIDTASATRFHWNGRIRVVEQTTDEIGPLLIFQRRTCAHSIDLVGDDGRNIVVRPTGHAADEHPVGRVEKAGEPKPVIQAVLAMSLRKTTPGWADLAGPASQRAKSSESAGEMEARSHQLGDEMARMSRASQMLSDRKFDQMDGAEAVAAAGGRTSYTVFDLGDGVTLKAWLENRDPASVRATVYDRDGKVLHEYKPIELPLKEIVPPAR